MIVDFFIRMMEWMHANEGHVWLLGIFPVLTAMGLGITAGIVVAMSLYFLCSYLEAPAR